MNTSSQSVSTSSHGSGDTPERSPKIRRLLGGRPSWIVRFGSLLLLLLFSALAAGVYLVIAAS